MFRRVSLSGGCVALTARTASVYSRCTLAIFARPSLLCAELARSVGLGGPFCPKRFCSNETRVESSLHLRRPPPVPALRGVDLQRACRDFCARFPDSAMYAMVRI